MTFALFRARRDFTFRRELPKGNSRTALPERREQRERHSKPADSGPSPGFESGPRSPIARSFSRPPPGARPEPFGSGPSPRGSSESDRPIERQAARQRSGNLLVSVVVEHQLAACAALRDVEFGNFNGVETAIVFDLRSLLHRGGPHFLLSTFRAPPWKRFSLGMRQLRHLSLVRHHGCSLGRLSLVVDLRQCHFPAGPLLAEGSMFRAGQTPAAATIVDMYT